MSQFNGQLKNALLIEKNAEHFPEDLSMSGGESEFRASIFLGDLKQAIRQCMTRFTMGGKVEIGQDENATEKPHFLIHATGITYSDWAQLNSAIMSVAGWSECFHTTIRVKTVYPEA